MANLKKLKNERKNAQKNMKKARGSKTTELIACYVNRTESDYFLNTSGIMMRIRITPIHPITQRRQIKKRSHRLPVNRNLVRSHPGNTDRSPVSSVTFNSDMAFPPEKRWLGKRKKEVLQAVRCSAALSHIPRPPIATRSTFQVIEERSDSRFDLVRSLIDAALDLIANLVYKLQPRWQIPYLLVVPTKLIRGDATIRSLQIVVSLLGQQLNIPGQSDCRGKPRRIIDTNKSHGNLREK